MEHKRLIKTAKNTLDKAEIRPSDAIILIVSNKEGLWAMNNNLKDNKEALKMLENIVKELKKTIKP